MNNIKILLANPRGFCAGVDRAIEIVERTLKKYGAPIYVRNEVVHNRFVVKSLREKGVVFVKEIDEVPENAVIVFSAHGVSQQVRLEAIQKNRTVLDATCPLVTKVHKEVMNKQNQDHQVILIGHSGHPEVEGTLGQSNKKQNIALLETVEDIDNLPFAQNDSLSYTTQTTLSVEDTQKIVTVLKQKYPNIASPKRDDICYATQNRQDAVKKIMLDADMLIVLGSANSSNSNRLKEIALKMKKPAFLIDGENEIDFKWFKNVKTVGITAGASAPESLVQGVIERIKLLDVKTLNVNKVIEVAGQKENTVFPLPIELRNC
jgi:4-hydroxy-3-methylbut-2-enyl diphosphate reductase